MEKLQATCPKCEKNVKAAREEAFQREKELKQSHSAELKKLGAKSEAAVQSLRKEFENKLIEEKARLENQSRKASSELLSTIDRLKAHLEELSGQLSEAKSREISAQKRQHELEERERTLAQTIERTLDQERGKIMAEAAAKSAEGRRAADREKDDQLADLRRQIEELKRQAWLTSRFLSSPEFRKHFEAMREAFLAVKEDLEAEKQALEQLRSKRERQISRAIAAADGMFSDLKSLVDSHSPQPAPAP